MAAGNTIVLLRSLPESGVGHVRPLKWKELPISDFGVQRIFELRQELLQFTHQRRVLNTTTLSPLYAHWRIYKIQGYIYVYVIRLY